MMIENLDQLKMKKKKKKRTENNKRQTKKTLLTKKIEVFQSNDGGYEEDMQIKMPRYSWNIAKVGVKHQSINANSEATFVGR